MNSPIKTVIENKTNRQHVITCIPRRRIIIAPNGQCTLDGDVFSQCDNSRSVETLLSQMTSGQINISFIVDSVFEVKHGGAILFVNSVTRRNLDAHKEMLKDVVIDTADSAKEPEDESKQAEEPKQEEKTEEPAKEEKPAENADENVKLGELAAADSKQEEKTEEPAKEEKPAEAPKKQEEPKQEPAKAVEKQKAPKKVQVK